MRREGRGKRGSAAGLTLAGQTAFDELGLGGDPGLEDFFGSALVAGRFRGTTSASLAVGATLWDAFGLFNVGRVAVLHSTELFRTASAAGNSSSLLPSDGAEATGGWRGDRRYPPEVVEDAVRVNNLLSSHS